MKNAYLNILFFQDYVKLLTEVDWKSSTTTNFKTGEITTNNKIRSCKSLIHQLSILFPYETLNDFCENNHVEITEYLDIELLKYDEGDFFAQHTDRKKSKSHNYTMMIFPPSNGAFEGGDFIVGSTTIKCDSLTDWTIVIFDITQQHEVTKVLSGTRYAFKTTLKSSNLKKQIYITKLDGYYFTIHINKLANKTKQIDDIYEITSYDKICDKFYNFGCYITNSSTKYYDFPSYKRKLEAQTIHIEKQLEYQNHRLD